MSGFQEVFNAQYLLILSVLSTALVLAGSINSYETGYCACLVKTDANGSEQWNRTIGPGLIAKIFSIWQTKDGVYLLGETTSPFGSSDVWLVRIDPEGVKLWNRTFGDPDSNDRLYYFQQTSDDGFILAGRSVGPRGPYNFWLIKTGPEGEELWNRNYGGSGDEKVYSILQTSDGGYIAAGEIGSSKENFYDIWVIKTDPDGKLQWQESFGGTGHDVARSVLLAPDGGLVVAGDKDSCSEQGIDFWLIKLGGIPAEPEGGNAPTDGEPVQTPDIPGFDAAVAVMGLLVWVGLVRRRR
jgi:hypothetical protein